MEFRDNVIQTLKNQRITQTDLARKMGKSRQNISMLLRPGRQVSLKTAQEFATALGVSVSDLLGSHLDNSPNEEDPRNTIMLRLSKFLKIHDINPARVLDILRINEEVFQMMIDKHIAPSDETIRLIAVAFWGSNLNMDWLKTGVGEATKIIFPFPEKALEYTPKIDPFYQEMARINGHELSPVNEQAFNLRGREHSTEFRDLGYGTGRFVITTPLISYSQLYGYSNYLEIWDNIHELDLFRRHAIVVDSLKFGVYTSFVVNDGALNMESDKNIAAGDIVTGRRIEKKYWKTELPNALNVIVCSKSGVFFRQIKIENSEKIFLSAANPDKEKYPDFELDIDNTFEIYEIEVVTRYKKRQEFAAPF